MRRLISTLVLLTLAGCAAQTGYGPSPAPPMARAPSRLEQQFGWSSGPGRNSIRGAVAYRDLEGRRYSCAGRSVALTPVAPISRARTVALYGSDQHAVASVEAVRQRSGDLPAPTYGAWLRSATCAASGRFAFDGLPDGDWFLIVTAVPSRAGGEPLVIMRRIDARGGAVRTVEVR